MIRISSSLPSSPLMTVAASEGIVVLDLGVLAGAMPEAMMLNKWWEELSWLRRARFSSSLLSSPLMTVAASE